jgi:GAF domain-containing protein
MERNPELDQALGDLGRALQSSGGLDDALLEVAKVSARIVPGVDDASVTLWQADGPYTFASTSDAVTRIDRAQYEVMAGPCVDAARSGEVLVVEDTGAETRWEQFAAAARREGVLASLSLPLRVGTELIGSLNLYGQRPLPAEAADVGSVVASFGGLVSLTATALVQARAKADNLQTALVSRATIDRAVGIVMSQQGLGQEAAFDALVRLSQTSNRKLRDIATAVVASFDQQGRSDP